MPQIPTSHSAYLINFILTTDSEVDIIPTLQVSKHEYTDEV